MIQDIYIVMGQYTIVKKERSMPKAIYIPAIQSCIAVILNSPKGIAAIHIDTPLSAREGMNTVIKKLAEATEIKENEIQYNIGAVLIGGDFGFNFFSSTPIYKEIIETLKIHNISYTHHHYSENLPIWPAAYGVVRMGLYLGDFLGPQSWYWEICGMALACLASLQRTKIVDAKAMCEFERSKDSQDIEVFVDNKKNSKQILKKISVENFEQSEFLRRRICIDPQDPNQKKALTFQYVDPQPGVDQASRGKKKLKRL